MKVGSIDGSEANAAPDTRGAGPIDVGAIGAGPIPGRTVAHGAAWRIAEAIGGETVALLVFVAMARLLVPEHFGIVALAGVFVAAGQVVLQQGLPDAVIRTVDATAAHFATAFWCNTAFGSALAGLLALLALPAAAAFAEPELAPVLAALALGLPLSGAAAVLQAKLVRRMAFKAVALRTLIATTAGGSVGLGLALLGAGAWALVGLQLTSAVAGLAVLLIMDPWRPRWLVERRLASELVRFALPVMGTHLAKFAGKKLDIAVLGLFVPATALGHYFLASRLVFALGLATYYAIFALTLPVLARLDAASPAFRRAAGQALWLTTALCLPAGLGLALTAGPLVPFVFGVVWAPSTAPLAILAAFSIFYALGLIAGQIMVAAGRPALFLRLTLINTALFLAMVAAAAPHGLAMAALAGCLANVVMLPAYLLALRRAIGLELAGLGREQLPLWAAGGLMVGAILALEATLPATLAPLPRLAATIAVGLVVYAAALGLLAPREFTGVWRGVTGGSTGTAPGRTGAPSTGSGNDPLGAPREAA